jgi:hypothetical protein
MRDADIASQSLSTTADQDGCRVVDQAVGVLVLALRLTPDTAEQLLSRVARRHLLTAGRLGAAVLAAASGEHVDDPLARKVAWQMWGDLLL